MIEGAPGEQAVRGETPGRLAMKSGRRTRRWDGWKITRAVLLVIFVVLVGGTWLGGAKHSSYNDLRGDIASGRTHSITVTGGLPPGAVGDAMVRIQWHAGHHGNYTQVTEASTTGDVSTDGTDPVLYGDVAAQLQALAPQHDLEVKQSGFSSGTEIAGWQVPDWVSPAAILLWLGTLLVLVNGPQPLYATRWAWFWMIGTPLAIVGLPLFLLVSSPWRSTGFVSLVKERWRLTGGWAFLIAFVLGSVFRLSFSG